jgi:hypothetical protein
VEQREKKVNQEDRVHQDRKLANLESQEGLDLPEKQVIEVLLEFQVKTADLDQRAKRDPVEVLELLECLAAQVLQVSLVDRALMDQVVRKVQPVSLVFLEKQVETVKTDILAFLAKPAHKDLLVRAFLVLLEQQDFRDREAALVQEELLEHLAILAKMVREEKLLSDRKENLACLEKMDHLEFQVTLANLD